MIDPEEIVKMEEWILYNMQAFLPFFTICAQIDCSSKERSPQSFWGENPLNYLAMDHLQSYNQTNFGVNALHQSLYLALKLAHERDSKCC